MAGLPLVVAAIDGRVRFDPSLTSMPWLIRPVVIPCGFITNHATPSTGFPDESVAALPSTAQSLPFAYETPPMRESSGSSTFSVTVAGPLNPSPSRLQHGRPVTGGASAVLPMQVASGTLPDFCVGGAGTPYSSVFTSENVSWRSGDDESSDLVFDKL